MEKKILTSIILFLFITNYSWSQSEWRSWSSVQLNYKANDKITMIAKPIIRHFDDLSKYNNTSIDLIISYKLPNNLKVSVLNRHWWEKHRPDREFWFFDLKHSLPLNSQLTFSNQLRYHLAVNWGGLKEPDFIRYAPSISYKTNFKLTASFTPEFFYRTNGINVLSGGRYILGFNYPLSDRLKLTAQYWRHIEHNDESPFLEANFLILNLGYNLN